MRRRTQGKCRCGRAGQVQRVEHYITAHQREVSLIGAVALGVALGALVVAAVYNHNHHNNAARS